MDKKFINQLRNQLKDRRHHLLKEVMLRLREFRDSARYRLTDMTDIASNHIDDEIVMSIAQGEAREIEEIDNALNQIKKGKYGVCENCGKKINKQRLMAIPFVRLCLKCKEEEERDKGVQDERGGYYRIDSVDYGEFEKDNEKSESIKYIEKSDISPFDN